MKKISEMTLEELQDHAVKLTEENKALTDKNTALEGEKTNLEELNKALQKRNNDLFMKVEQSIPEPSKDEDKAMEKPVESCEDFARNLILGDK